MLKVIRKENRCIVEGVNTVSPSCSKLLFILLSQCRERNTSRIKRNKQDRKSNWNLHFPFLTWLWSIHLTSMPFIWPWSYACISLATSVDYKTVNGEKVRVSKRTGTVIPKPQEVLSRQTPRNTNIGPKDTLPDDVCSNSPHFDELGDWSDIQPRSWTDAEVEWLLSL